MAMTRVGVSNTSNQNLGGPRNQWTRGHSANRYTNRSNLMEFTHMKQLMQNAEPNEVLLKLVTPKCGFVEALQRPIPTDASDNVETVIGILTIALQEKHSPANINRLLNIVNTSSFLQLSLVPYLTFVLTCQRGIPPNSLFHDICSLLEVLMQQLPASSHQNVTVVLSQLTLINITLKGREHFADLEEKLKALQILQEGVIKQIHDGEILPDQENSSKTEFEEPPPDDFRQISVVPTAQDITMDTEPYLRKNIVYGSYKDVDHYLDIQFRLLREDFLQPLRLGIRELVKNITNPTQLKHLQDVRAYTGVHFCYPLCSRAGILMRISFDVSHFGRVRWESTKRLIYGSLVCLSRDRFRTIILGTVAERNPADLKLGKVDIRIDDSRNMDINPYTEYQMVECSAYFEAYRHNLEGLQEMNVTNVPFQKYLLNKTDLEMSPPKYLLGQSIKFNFAPILKRKRIKADVMVLDKKTWPKPEDLGLDESQFRALQTALTTEFSCIQGPPGTGKTYIGLKIVQLLLANASVWGGIRLNTRPILVVCFTNHALDQFLEGILDMSNPESGDVVRIGGRSSSDNAALKQCLLPEIKRERRDRIPQTIMEAQSGLYEQTKNAESRLVALMEDLASVQNGIVHENALSHVMLPQHVKSLLNPCIICRSRIAYWLLSQSPDMGVKASTTLNQEMWDEGIEDHNLDVEGNISGNTQAGSVDQSQPSNIEDDFALEEAMREENTRRMYEGDEEKDYIGKSSRACIEKNKLKNTALEITISDVHGTSHISQKSRPKDENVWQYVMPSRKKMKQIVNKELHRTDQMSHEDEERVFDIWKLQPVHRWKLYRLWVSQLCFDISERMKYAAEEFNNMAKQLGEVRAEGDFHVIKGARVVGMTTTGAAKNRRILQKLKPRIIIVEEAAEVLESHIITSLSDDCQHLILIGDHQQLRPNPTVYKLAKEFHLDISLFERMVKNNLHCEKLQIQHRMRPEIVKLIVPHVYPSLSNAKSVEKYDKIKGIGGNIFFINHTKAENKDDDTRSHSNTHEARFVTALAKYIVQQGYNANQVTVLTTYTGQMFEIRRRLRGIEELTGMRVTPVDNYQGEENDIIILSLVRSNEDGKIGFLNVSNRVCVALSRARKGFYAIGNMDLLRSTSRLWNTILKEQVRENTVVEGLPLCCQNHPDNCTNAIVEEDFRKAPEGGCMQKCEFRLDCGHVCELKCHPRDPDHKEYKCMKPCLKYYEKCPLQHKCTKLCHDECGVCRVLVEKTLVPCGHTYMIPCSVSPEEFKCPSPCENQLSCGHICSKFCGDPCISSRECDEIVNDRKWPCGHILSTNCKHKPTNFSCPIMVTKALPCGHIVEMCCSEEDDSYLCQKRVPVILCERDCKNEVACHMTHDKLPICKQLVARHCPSKKNHEYFVKCNEYDTAVCTQQCEENLDCGHQCKGKCGNCARGTHAICQHPCQRFLSCQHRCSSVCGKPCPPCQQQCRFGCPHMMCRDKCGMACQPCAAPCLMACEHRRCTRKCSEECDLPPCNARCKIMMQCGHRCPGLCGETCPKACVICNSSVYRRMETTLEVTFSKKDRVVLLEPCYHVVPVAFMDRVAAQYEARQRPMEVELFMCPICKHIIYYCPRYKNRIMQSLKSLRDIKMKICQDFQLYDKLFSMSNSSSANEMKHVLDQKIQKGDAYARKCLGCLCLLGGMADIGRRFKDDDKSRTREYNTKKKKVPTATLR